LPSSGKERNPTRIAYERTRNPTLIGKVTRSALYRALYRTLDRLGTKGLVEWELEPSSVPERGGHPIRRLTVTEEGLEAARASHAVLMRFFDGLRPVSR
jgi:hypothetical protein